MAGPASGLTPTQGFCIFPPCGGVFPNNSLTVAGSVGWRRHRPVFKKPFTRYRIFHRVFKCRCSRFFAVPPSNPPPGNSRTSRCGYRPLADLMAPRTYPWLCCQAQPCLYGDPVPQILRRRPRVFGKQTLNHQLCVLQKQRVHYFVFRLIRPLANGSGCPRNHCTQTRRFARPTQS